MTIFGFPWWLLLAMYAVPTALAVGVLYLADKGGLNGKDHEFED